MFKTLEKSLVVGVIFLTSVQPILAAGLPQINSNSQKGGGLLTRPQPANTLKTLAPAAALQGGPLKSPTSDTSMQLKSNSNTKPQQLGAGDPAGGGCVKNESGCETFYSAGIRIQTEMLQTEEEVPGMPELLQSLTSMNFLGLAVKSEISAAALPGNIGKSFKRIYKRVIPESLTPEIEDLIKSEFSKATGVKLESLDLAAVTDRKSNTTYLLPKFYELKSISQQQAILFHEAVWIVRPASTYKEVINMEVAFQAVIENHVSLEEIYKAKAYLISKLSSMDDILNLTFKLDLESGALKKLGLLDDEDDLVWGRLTGADYIACENRKRSWEETHSDAKDSFLFWDYVKQRSYHLSVDLIDTSGCESLLYSSLYNLNISSQKKSAFITALIKHLSDRRKLYLRGIIVLVSNSVDEKFIFNIDSEMQASNIRINLFNGKLAVKLTPKNISQLFNLKYRMMRKEEVEQYLNNNWNPGYIQSTLNYSPRKIIN